MWFSKKPFRFENKGEVPGSWRFNDSHYPEAKCPKMMNGTRKENRFCSFIQAFHHIPTSVKSKNENFKITHGAFMPTLSQ